MLGFAMLALLTPLLLFGGWRYLEGTLRLRDRVEVEAPELFERLGKPQVLYRNVGLPGMNTLDPLLPWLQWIHDPKRFGGVPAALRADHARQRRLLYACVLGLLLWGLAFMTAGPPDAS